MPLNSWTPEKDHQRIIFASTCYDFPLIRRGHWNLRFFVPFASSISALLDRTGEFAQRSQKRYDDTDIIVSEIAGMGL
jgi:hypothetical protein